MTTSKRVVKKKRKNPVRRKPKKTVRRRPKKKTVKRKPARKRGKKKTKGGSFRNVAGVGLTTLGVLGAIGNIAEDPTKAILGSVPLIASGVGLLAGGKKKNRKKKH